jgi:hypothetical protein
VLPVSYELHGRVLLQVASISQLTVSRLSRQCGVLNISQLYRPTRPVTGITFYLKVNVKFSLCLAKYYATKVYGKWMYRSMFS